MAKINLPNDSILMKHLAVDVRKKLNNETSDIAEIGQQVVRSILEIPICGAISTTNITLSGVQTIDGISTDTIELLCVNGQTDQTQNGVYVCAAGAYSRYENMTAGCLVRVIGGTVNELTWWNNDNTTLDYGTTNITFSYLLSEASIATLTDVTLTSLANNQILLYNSTLGKWVNSTYAGLPSGTVNQTLWHNGTAWTATSKLYVDIGGTANQYRVRSPSSDSVYINVITYDDIVSVNGNIGSNNGFILDSSNTAGASQLKLINAYSYAWLRNKTFDATKKCILITSGGASGITDERFLVYMDGEIFSKFYEGTGDRYLGADSTGNFKVMTDPSGVDELSELIDVVLTAPADGDILVYDNATSKWINAVQPTIPTDISDLTDTTLLIPENHYSFNPADATFQNLSSGATTLTAIPNFKVALSANKRYAVECTVYLVTGTAFDIADNDFNLQLIGNAGWLASNKFVAHHELIVNRALGNTYMPQLSGLETDILCTVYNTTPGIQYASLTIKGHIDTGANADDLELFCRVVSTGYTDNTKNVVIGVGSSLKAVECSIN